MREGQSTMSRDEIRPGLAFPDRFLRIVYIAAIFGIGLSARGAAYTKLKGGIIPFIFCAAIDFCFRFKLDSAKTLWAFLKGYSADCARHAEGVLSDINSAWRCVRCI